MSRQHVKDTAKHVILGTQQFKPTEFAAQINLNMDNAWGILRCIVDTCMKLKEGKYLIMKDPNKVSTFLSLSVVSLPLSLFNVPHEGPQQGQHLPFTVCRFTSTVPF